MIEEFDLGTNCGKLPKEFNDKELYESTLGIPWDKKKFVLSDKIINTDPGDGMTFLQSKYVKEFIKRRLYDATKLLALFNQGKLTSIDLREHRQRIKDETGEKLI